MSESFGQKVRNAREKKKFSLEELANRLGSTKSYVWQLENKSPARPSGRMLLRLAKELDVSPEFLIDDDVEEATDEQFEGVLFRKVKGKKLTSEDAARLSSMIDLMFPDEDN